MPSSTTSLPERLRSKPTSFLGWSEFRDPMLVGVMARSGYDAVLLDQQHGFHDGTSCIAGISEAALAHTPVLVRVPVGDFAQAARMLDFGAAGIVAPMINSADDARAFVSFVKYPPLGQRSFGPGRDMQLRGIGAENDYLATANAASLAIVMCETRGALAALDDILAVPGVDGVLAGPGDLSVALCDGQAFDPTGEAVQSAMKHIANRTRSAGKFACGFAGSAEGARRLAREGYHLVSVGYDGGIIADAFSTIVAQASA
ncbi:MAG TPA: aldolase/citrate lyase family protein [Steroidobacteraceae bacterium]